jgi:hypothetical protein
VALEHEGNFGNYTGGDRLLNFIYKHPTLFFNPPYQGAEIAQSV